MKIVFPHADEFRAATKSKEEAFEALLEEEATSVHDWMAEQAAQGFFTYTTPPLQARVADYIQDALIEAGFVCTFEASVGANGKHYKKLYIDWSGK